MKVQFVVVQLEIPAWAKRRALPIALAIGAGSLAYAAPPQTFMSGELLTAAALNANFTELHDRVATLEAPVSARYHIKAAQALPGEAFPALGMPLDYDTKDYDTANAVTPGAGWNFKAPIAGKYLITASVAGNCPTCASGSVFATIRVAINGVWDFEENALDTRYGWAGGNMSLSGSDVLDLAANDTVSIRFTENLVGSTFTAGGGAVTFTRISD